jgi:hypothetical protein
VKKKVNFVETPTDPLFQKSCGLDVSTLRRQYSDSGFMNPECCVLLLVSFRAYARLDIPFDYLLEKRGMTSYGIILSYPSPLSMGFKLRL